MERASSSRITGFEHVWSLSSYQLYSYGAPTPYQYNYNKVTGFRKFETKMRNTSKFLPYVLKTGGDTGVALGSCRPRFNLKK